MCPEGGCLYPNKLNIACEISSFPLSLKGLRLVHLRCLSNGALGRFANDLERWTVLEQHRMNNVFPFQRVSPCRAQLCYDLLGKERETEALW